MSDATGEPGQASGRDAIEGRAWPKDMQLRAAGLAALALLAIVVCVWLGERLLGAHPPPAAPAAAPPGTFRATAQQLKTLTVETVGVRGFVSEELTEGKIAVNGDRSTPVYSPFSGRVTRLIAGLGDAVKQGGSLASIEATEFVQAQNELSTANAQVKLARINETRKHALYDAKGGSLQDWQQAQSDLTGAAAAAGAVRNRLRILGKSDAQIDALGSARRIDPSATLVAPIAGVVVDRQVGPGQYLQAGSGTPVFTIADPSNVWLVANVREADSGLVHVGQRVEVHVLAYPQRSFEARVSYVAALLDPATHRLPVRADIDNRDGALKPEMFASFRILTGDTTQSPAVPESAVVYEGDAAHVWVASGDGLLAYRAIHTGRNNQGLIEVIDGLKPGERIVTKGGLFIDQVATPAAP